MKKTILFGILLLLSGCASFVPMGSLYSEGKLGLQDNGGSGTKVGRACVHSVLALFAVGDGSIEAAKASAGITKVSIVDYEVQNILGIFGDYCTVVKGE